MSHPPEWLGWITETPDMDALRQRYDQWASAYDADVHAEWGAVPGVAAEMMGRMLGERDAPILDAGAGTGLTGTQLAAVGFRHVEGVDLSPGMLARAEQRGVYRRLHVGVLEDVEALPATSPWAGIIATGVFAEGHCGPDALIALLDRLRPGGALVFTAREPVLSALEAILAGREGERFDRRALTIYGDQQLYVVGWMASTPTPRHARLSSRLDESVVPPTLWRPLSARYADTRWRGIHLDKGPFELAMFPQLIHEQGIASIIELGAGTGGAAVWYADLLAQFGRPGPVLAIDHDPAGVDPRAIAHAGVRFVEGDCNRCEAVLTPALLAQLPHPWLVVEDAHANLIGVLDHLERSGLTRGDYVIVEDTNIAMCDAWDDWSDGDVLERCRRKLPELRAWLDLDPARARRWRVDTWYQDLFGHNASKTWNAVFRIME